MCIYRSFVQLQVLHVCFCIYSSTASLVRGFLSTILFRQTNNNPSLYISCTIFLQCSSVYTQFFIRDYSFFLTFTHSLPLYLSLSHTLLLSLSLTYTHSRTHTHSHTHNDLSTFIQPEDGIWLRNQMVFSQPSLQQQQHNHLSNQPTKATILSPPPTQPPRRRTTTSLLSPHLISPHH